MKRLGRLNINKNILISVLGFSLAFSTAEFSLSAGAYSALQLGRLPAQSQRDFSHPRYLSIPLDPTSDVSKSDFELFYFSNTKKHGKLPTVLIFDGLGASSFPEPRVRATMDGLQSIGYNTVFVHRRGSGFSQIPNQLAYDPLIRTTFVIEDLERLRKFLGLERWEVIATNSYGSFQSVNYAKAYPASIGRLILSSPINNINDTGARTSQIIENLTSALNHFAPKLTSLDASHREHIIQQVQQHFQNHDLPFYSQLALADGYLPMSDFNHPFNLNIYLLQLLKNASRNSYTDPVELAIVTDLVNQFFPAKVPHSLKQNSGKIFSQLKQTVLAGVQNHNDEHGSYPNCCHRTFAQSVINDTQLFADFFLQPISVPTMILQGAGDSIVPRSGVMKMYSELLAGRKEMLLLNNFGHLNFFDLIPAIYTQRLLAGDWDGLLEEIITSLDSDLGIQATSVSHRQAACEAAMTQ